MGAPRTKNIGGVGNADFLRELGRTAIAAAQLRAAEPDAQRLELESDLRGKWARNTVVRLAEYDHVLQALMRTGADVARVQVINSDGVALYVDAAFLRNARHRIDQLVTFHQAMDLRTSMATAPSAPAPTIDRTSIPTAAAAFA